MKNLKDTFPSSTKEFHNRIEAALESLPDRKEIEFMERKKYIKRGLITAACAAVILGTAALARGPVASTILHSWSFPEYTSMPSSEQIKKDTGVENLNIPEEFKSGYKFINGNIIDGADYDENGNSLRKYKEAEFCYKKEDGAVFIYAQKSNPDSRIEEDKYTSLAGEYNGSEIYYTYYQSKCLPPDYKMTEQDKADEESGKYVFSFGSSEIKISDVQSVSFETGGNHIEILCMDSSADKDELLDMAKEIIDA